MKKHILKFVSAMLVLTMILAGCGSKAPEKAPELKDGEALELVKWSMNASAWSSPNGATVNITATPNGYTEGQSAVFTILLEGEEIAAVPCEWDGSVYTASADLNAADGYCYYVLLTAADGAKTEVAVNTPTAPTDDSLINMESALNAFCEASITATNQKDGQLVVEEGSISIHLPFLTLDTGAVTCQKAALIFMHNGADVSTQELKVSQADASGVCTADLSGTTFSIPSEIADDDQLGLRLDVTLSNGHMVSASAGNWHYMDGQLSLAVG